MIKKEGLRRGLSIRTINTYSSCLKNFLNKCKKEPIYVTKKDIKGFLDDLSQKGDSGSTINVNLNALKFYFGDLLGRKMNLNIKYSKIPKRLPVVLTQEETKRLIESIENEEHKLMIQLMYSAGLRVSELVNLKVKDLEIDKGYGWVRHGKGNKDRLIIIAEKLKEKLREKIKNLNYEEYLFKGNKEYHISSRTLQEIIKQAAKKAEIEKTIHCHTLRHSFATHLIENGYDVTKVQSLLGHNSTQTTMIYVHMATNKFLDVKSPLDEL